MRRAAPLALRSASSAQNGAGGWSSLFDADPRKAAQSIVAELA